MFLNHFKMSNHPFKEKPDIKWVLNDERFAQAAARLKFFQDQGSMALVIGKTGVGKSTLIRVFKNSVPKNRYQIIYLHLTNLKPEAFLRLIVRKLGESPKLGKDRLFFQIFERIKKSETHTILIIDEAHLLSSQSLTDLRLIISSAEESHLPVKIILCGQETLAPVLNRTDHTDLLHRICVRCGLRSFTKVQSTVYIDHLLTCAGSSEKLFDPDAKNLIHDYSGGVARQINNIATACLINAASKNKRKIDENIVNETMNEFLIP